MRLISWNTNGRVARIEEQIEAVKKQRCDLVALQEITAKTAPIWVEALQGMGLTHTASSFQTTARRPKTTGRRKYGELIASRWPLRRMPGSAFHVPWPERVLSVSFDSPHGNIQLHTTHIPPGVTNGWIKIEMLEGIYERLARHTTTHRILCGDFNTPQEEMRTGRVITWDQEGTRWDLGERNVLVGLARYDLIDVYRDLNGYRVQDFSWYAPHGIGRRFDHVFACDRCWRRSLRLPSRTPRRWAERSLGHPGRLPH